MKKPIISLIILARHKSAFSTITMVLCGLMFSGCAQTSKSFAWLKKAPQNVVKNLPTPSPKIKNPANLHVAYARWQEQMGKMSEAQVSYEQALSDNPKSVDAILGLARLDHLAGRELAAEHGFQKALRLKPNDGHSLDTIGQFYVTQKKWPEAIEMLTAAMAAEPKESSYQYHLGVALARSGDINAALPHLEKTVGKPAAHYNIGYVLMEENRYGLAQDHFRQAVALNPELLAAQTMLDVINKKTKQPGMKHQSPVLASQQPVSPSIQTISGKQTPAQWRTLTAESESDKIIPQSYQKQSQDTKTKWAPAVYYPQYDQTQTKSAFKSQPKRNSVQGNRSMIISPKKINSNGSTQTAPSVIKSSSPITTSSHPITTSSHKVIPEQYSPTK